MRARSFVLLSVIVTMALALPGEVSPISAKAQLGASVVPARVSDRVPTAAEPQNASTMFVENVGQFDERARFQMRGGNGTLWLAEDAMWMSIVGQPKEVAGDAGRLWERELAPTRPTTPSADPEMASTSS